MLLQTNQTARWLVSPSCCLLKKKKKGKATKNRMLKPLLSIEEQYNPKAQDKIVIHLCGQYSRLKGTNPIDH